ncbi:cilia- and flagella-associated protein 161 isoform X2 [Eupeodes corollae]|uniref:cilia- and flagella-associated protein 161 isoform X2 n=1 Tax=Eupeodes corollae TaxID=290404 RepID=UPI0024936E8F|nr:cilia- and flagella-associated protein 161 isoform X2 [Eupeodes corollae]
MRRASENYIHYGRNVRIGNWYEDFSLEEDEIKTFLRKRHKSELLIQKTRLLFVNFHAKVDIDSSPNHIRFGAVVQLLSCMKSCPDNSDPNFPSALSVIINEQVVRKSRLKINDLCELTVAPSVQPCVRNTFKIMSADNRDRNGEPLRFGEHFIIQCVDAEEQPLLLLSMQKSANLTYMAQTTFESCKRGEINLSVALCLKKNIGPGKDIPYAYSKWRCYHSDPNKRFETEGQPVPKNCPLIITHLATNRNLSTENILIQNYIDFSRRLSPKNLWIISIGNKKDSEEEKLPDEINK